MIAARHHFAADVVVKRSRFWLWQPSGIFEVSDLDRAYLDMTPQDWAAGSALAFSRDVWKRIGFNGNFPIGEDVEFVKRACLEHFKVKMSDPFNHVIKQYFDRGHHTYDPDPLWLASGLQRHLLAINDVALAEV